MKRVLALWDWYGKKKKPNLSKSRIFLLFSTASILDLLSLNPTSSVVFHLFYGSLSNLLG